MHGVVAVDLCDRVVGKTADQDARAMAACFWSICAVHTAVWWAIACLTQPNPPLDTIEILAWGNAWQWGYYKHPPLPAWITDAIAVATGRSVWGIYLAAQFSVVAMYWAVWRLARELLPPRSALLAVALLECCYFYNCLAIELNNNVALYPFWSFSILLLFWGTTTGRSKHWLGLGICFGLGLLCKYSIGLLGLAMLGYLVLDPHARRAWTTPGPYLAAATALGIFAPHLVWAMANNFPGLEYAATRTESKLAGIGHLVYPALFVLGQLPAVLPMLAAAEPILWPKYRVRAVEGTDRVRRRFLIAMVLGPLALHLAIAALANLKLRSFWGSLLWCHLGILILYCMETSSARVLWRRVAWRCAIVGAVLVGIAVVRNVGGPFLQGRGSRIHFPGPVLADEVETLWRQRYGGSVPILAGDAWFAGNASFFHPDRPPVYSGRIWESDFELSPRQCPWITEEEFDTCGGVILWDLLNTTEEVERKLLECYPRAVLAAPILLPWQSSAPVPPAQVGVAILPPRSRPLKQ